jgi:molecular chaperone GrpE
MAAMPNDPTRNGNPGERPEDPLDLDIPQKPAGDTAPAGDDLAARVEQLEGEKAILQDKFLRAVADTQNARRRAEQDVDRARKFGVENFAKDVVGVADNLGRALSALPGDLESLDPAIRNLITGIQATERQLQSALERQGVTRIESVGQPFNAEFHQAMMEVEDASVPTGTVVQELIPGYLIAGRLLRAAMVAVSKGGPMRTPTPANDAAVN